MALTWLPCRQFVILCYFPPFPFPLLYLSPPLSLGAALSVAGLLSTEPLDSLFLWVFLCQVLRPLLLCRTRFYWLYPPTQKSEINFVN